MSQRKSADAWAALGTAPWRFLLSPWPWRSFAYIFSSAVLGFMLMPLVVATLLLAPLWGILLGWVERWRVRLLGFPRIAPGHVPLGWDRRSEWLGVRLREPVTWRETAYLLVSMVFGTISFFILTIGVTVVTIPFVTVLQLGDEPLRINFFADVWVITQASDALPLFLIALLCCMVLGYLNTVLAAGQASVARALLSPRQEELERQVARLTVSRASLLNAFEAERRRIERDLHDGTQQQLVATSMALGVASLELETVEGAAGEKARLAVERAHAQAESALASLRDIVRGIHPQVLVDHGLEAAVGELVGRLPLAVEISIELPRRLSAGVESSAYFVVSEALTNVVRHAQAQRVAVSASLVSEGLWLQIVDDGVGGANEAAGSGLAGLRERAEVLGGTFSVLSPEGGPTTIRLTVPLA